MKIEIIMRFQLPEETPEKMNRRITKVYEMALDGAVDIQGECGVKLLGAVEIRED